MKLYNIIIPFIIILNIIYTKNRRFLRISECQTLTADGYDNT